MFEQHREKGRFVPVLPRNVQNTPGVSPRDTFSQNVKKHTKMKYDIHQEDLRKWFDPHDPEGGWKRINSKGEAIGPCAREPGEAKPKCMSNAKRASLTKQQRASAVKAKRKHDPNPERTGKPINVSNYGKGKLGESMEQLDEKNSPTNPKLWARAKSLAKSKFSVYPSAYANGWAAKWYKSKGGGWKTVSEAVNPAQQAAIAIAMKKAGKKPKNMKEENDPHEYADGEMSIHQLKQIKAHADWILEMLKPDTDMPEWVQAKITLAADYLSTACDYLHVEMNEEVRGVYKDIKKIRDRKSINESDLPTTTAKEKIVTVRHKTSGKELDVVHTAVEKYKKLGYEPVNEQSNPFTRPGDNFQSKGKVPEPHSRGMKKEEVVDEMAGANMDTRAVHKHLKKGGWNLTRTKGGHDVFTHQKSPQHIAVPRHKQLKAPLIRGILKTASSVNESKTASIARGILMRKIDTMKLLKTPKPAQPKEPQKPAEPKMTTEELSKKAQIVKKAAKKVKDKFQADPVITQTYVKTENS